MADAISISPKPGIKCCAGDNKLYNITANTAPEKFRRLTNEDLFWTGESTYCVCNHHVEQHYTIDDQYSHRITIYCHGSNERCNCDDFRTRSVRLSHINCYKMVTESLAGDFEVPEIHHTQTIR
jgi:hypothetical protein